MLHRRMNPQLLPSRVAGVRVRDPGVDPESRILPREILCELTSGFRPALDPQVEEVLREAHRLTEEATCAGAPDGEGAPGSRGGSGLEGRDGDGGTGDGADE